MTLIYPSLDQIDIPSDRARDFSAEWAEALAGMIRQQGMLHPITLRQGEGQRLTLIAGLHRLAAHRILGMSIIASRVSDAATDDAARLEEVMENLGRNELIALDRCHHLFELKQVYDRMQPEAKFGGGSRGGHRAASGKTFPTGAEHVEIFGFAARTADKVGLSKRTINAAVKIWTELSNDSKARLPGTDLAAKQTELKALSEQSTARQAKILDLILGDGPADNVATAILLLNTGALPDIHERRFLAASRTLGGLDDAIFASVVTAHEARIIAVLKQRGSI